MSVLDRIYDIFDGVGRVAETLLKRVRILILLAFLSVIFIAFQLYSPESPWWWNTLKCLIPALPVTIWGAVYLILSQIREAPIVARELIADEDGLVSNLSNLDLQQVSNLRGAVSTLKTLRDQEGLEEVMETISGVGVLINPLFFLLAVLTFFGLFGLIFAALILMLF